MTFLTGAHPGTSTIRSTLLPLPVMVLAVDHNGLFVAWNSECERVTGYHAREIIGHPDPSSLLYPDKSEFNLLQRFWQESKGTYYSRVWDITCKDGTKRSISWSNISKEFPVDNWSSWSIGVDVTELKYASEQLNKGEQKFKMISDSLETSLVITDHNNMIIEANSAFTKLTGFKKNEIIGKNLDFFRVRTVNVNNATLRKNTGNTSRRFERGYYLHKDGSRVSVEEVTTSLRDPGNSSGVNFSILSEITDDSRLYNELIEHREYLHNVAKVSEVLLVEQNFSVALKKAFEIIGSDPGVDSVFLFELIKDEQNKQLTARKVIRWSKTAAEEAKFDSHIDELFFDPSAIHWANSLGKRIPLNVTADELPENDRETLNRKGIRAVLLVPVLIGEELWGFIGFSNRTTPEKYTGSVIAMMQSVALSIGGALQRELTNRELLATKQKAEEMNRLKNNFLANMSHELRTPLIGIIGYAEILLEEVPEPGMREMADRILSAGQRLSDSLSLILDISRIEANKLTLNLEDVRIGEIIQESVRYSRRDAELKDLNLTLNIGENLPVIRSDRRMLIQIIDNLLGNAIKFTHSGGVTVSANLLTVQERHFICIEVEDTGIGIASDLQEYIFKEFRQASEGLDRDYEGLGLGLTIIKKFTEKLGGTVELESTQGKGTKFTICLPVQNYNPVSEEASQKPDVKKILMIDDDMLVYSVSKVFLKDVGELFFATNAEQTYEMLDTVKPDLIILDIYLRDQYSGYDILREIRRRPELASVPVLAFTASTMPDMEESLISEGFDGYIPKPVVRASMVSIVNEFLHKAD